MNGPADDAAHGRGFIEGPWFDAFFFLSAPIWSLALGYAASLLGPEHNVIVLSGEKVNLTAMGMRTIIHAHLVIVLFRSHGNSNIRRLHPLRFWLAPPLLLAATIASERALLLVLVVTTYWDNYHSSLQTFGFGRMYDQRVGADIHRGRHLDAWLNLLIYFAPFMAGPLWQVILRSLEQSGVPAGHWLLRSLDAMQPWSHRILWIVVPVFCVVYIFHVVRRLRAGEPISWQKYVLYSSTAFASVWAWGFNAFGEALLIVNLFHAVQYFAIVWRTERTQIVRAFGLEAFPRPHVVAGSCFLLVSLLYGFWATGLPTSVWTHDLRIHHAILAISNTVALLHFWYDGFIWSVRKNQVR